MNIINMRIVWAVLVAGVAIGIASLLGFGRTMNAQQKSGDMSEIRIMTLDPGHFHAALVQKEMFSGVSPKVHVYGPLGFDLIEHLKRISGFNNRKENPTRWELEVHTGGDPLEQMLRERPGNVVVISGRNQGKINRIKSSVEAGLNVLVDKPWIINASDFAKLESLYHTAASGHLIAYDIMTERYEITTMLQRELIHDPGLFGEMLKGSEADPAVYFESIHHIFKSVAGNVNIRPAWFFDVKQQGEGVADIGTHLADLAQWMLFPEAAIDYRKDIRVLSGKRWPTAISLAEFKRVTNEPRFPEYLAPNVKGENLDYYCNGAMVYTLRGVHTKLDVIWNYEAPAGTGDTHVAIFKGSKSRVEVRQGKEESYRTEVYVVPNDPSNKAAIQAALRKRIDALQAKYPGIGMEEKNGRFQVTAPDRYRDGHEAHFAQVAARFFEYLRDPKSIPAWERANMLAKYHTTTKGLELGYRATTTVK